MPPTRTYASRRTTAAVATVATVAASVAPAVARAAARKAVKAKPKPKPKPGLTQLHLAFDNTSLKACKTCALTYTRGVADDEALHKTHCARVQRGLEWGRDEDKDAARAGVHVVDAVASLTPAIGAGAHGRIIAFRADAGGKVGAKLSSLLELVNTVLAAPPLPSRALGASRAYLFLLKPKGASREQIAGFLLVQRISSALPVLPDTPADAEAAAMPGVKLVHGLYCSPDPLPTALGIARIFVPLSYRRHGIARALLDAAAQTAVHGCVLDPRAGQIAFSQPTDSGRRLMDAWGVARVYEEDDDSNSL